MNRREEGQSGRAGSRGPEGAQRQRLELVPPIWDWQPGETGRQFRGFRLYRDLGPGRSLAQVAEIRARVRAESGSGKGGGSRSRLEQWSSRNRWVERAQAYDADLDTKRRSIREEELKAMQKQERMLGRAMVGLALTWLLGDPKRGIEPLDPSKLTAKETVWMAKVGAELSRLSRLSAKNLLLNPDMVTSEEFGEVTSDLITIALIYIPEKQKPAFADHFRAYARGEVRADFVNG